MPASVSRYTAPLIISLQLLPEEQAFFNALRAEHFPAHANYLDAHITLFHRLPAKEPLIRETLLQLARRPAMPITVTGVLSAGNWVAYTLESAELQQLHQSMQAAFNQWLIRQDRQPLRPHITIQNKVTAYKAQLLQQRLQAAFTPFQLHATGFCTWQYLKGPWKKVEEMVFEV